MIAILQGAPAYGGIEQHYVAHILRGLGDEAVLVCPDASALEPLRVQAARSETFPAGLSAPRTIVALARMLRRLRPRVAHAMDVWPAGVVAARIARVPRVIVTHHTVELPRSDNLVGRALWHLSWAVRPEVVYISETNRRKDARRRLRTHVQDYGLDLERFATGTRVLPVNGPVVGTVARLAPQKDQRAIVEAAPLVLEHHPRARFVIVGDGELRGDLEAQVRAARLEDHFTFTGARSDVPDLLASFDVYVLPSLFEGLPHSLIEAMAASVPVVTTATGGSAEIVADGVTGLLVPPREPPALAAAVVRLLDDREAAARMAAEAKRLVFERFSAARLVEQARALYSLA